MLAEVNTEKAWGSALKDPVIETKVIFDDKGNMISEGSVKLGRIAMGANEIVVQEGINNLKAIAEDIEKTIAYYHTLGGQSMAANHLSFLKRDILDTATRLEKECPSK